MKPYEQPITLPLNTLVDDILGDAHHAGVSKLTADIIESVVKNKHTCHIQRVDRDGLPLTYPRLWRIDAWRQDTESWRLAKLRSDKARDDRFIFQENVRRVALAITREFQIEGDAAHALAYRKVKNLSTCTKLLTEHLKVKLCYTLQDI